MFSCGKVASVFLLLCTLYFGAVTAQTAGTNVAVPQTMSKNQCWQAQKSTLIARRNADCGPKTGQDRENCIQAYRIVKSQLKEACRGFDVNLSVSRQSPVNLLLGYGIEAANIIAEPNGLTSFNDRQIIDATANNLVDYTSFADTALDFELQSDATSMNYYYTLASGNSATVTLNEGTYDLVRVDMKNPSEHTMSGRAGSAEIQYVFEKQVTVDEVDPDTELVVAFIVADFETSDAIINPANTDCTGGAQAPFADFLALSQSPTVTVSANMLRYVLKYPGSKTVSPYDARSLWLVAASWVNDPNGPSWQKGEWNYPTRPPQRALFSEAHMIQATTGVPIENGCTNF